MADVVWVIDDCPLTIMLVKVRLRSVGAQAFAFPSGRAAVAAWKAGSHPKPVAMLFDLDMHGSNGIETGRLLRDVGYTDLLLLHTGPTSARIVADLDTPFFDGLLVKPASSDSFAQLLEDAAAQRARRAA